MLMIIRWLAVAGENVIEKEELAGIDVSKNWPFAVRRRPSAVAAVSDRRMVELIDSAVIDRRYGNLSTTFLLVGWTFFPAGCTVRNFGATFEACCDRHTDRAFEHTGSVTRYRSTFNRT
jgi:hypothetical protein